MKKLFIILQILIFTSQSVYAADGAAYTQVITPPRPKNYVLPDMQLLDSVAFYNRFRDEHGKRVEVEGYVGRYGATFGEEFKQQIYEIESQSKEPVEIILSLTSTMEDAKILKQRMALEGRKMIIVELPDVVQKQILERANAQAAGGLKELWWETKQAASAVVHPIKTISNTAKTVRNKFVRPNKDDIGLVKLSVSLNMTSTAVVSGYLFMSGMDPSIAIGLGLVRTLIGGTTMAFKRTIANLYRAPLTSDLSVRPKWQQALLRATTMGVGLGELYYALGNVIDPVMNKLTHAQIITNAYTSGFLDTLASTERDDRLSNNAKYRMTMMSLVLSSVIGTFAITGFTGTSWVLEIAHYQLLELTTLQTISLSLIGAQLLAFKYFTRYVEKVAQGTMLSYLMERLRKFSSFRKLKEEREQQERQEILAKKNQNMEMLSEIKLRRTSPPLSTLNPVCTRLFL